jgi:hypothetical protein
MDFYQGQKKMTHLFNSFAAGHLQRLNKNITAQKQNTVGLHKPFQNKRI